MFEGKSGLINGIKNMTNMKSSREQIVERACQKIASARELMKMLSDIKDLK
jgi:hypothetical protein